MPEALAQHAPEMFAERRASRRVRVTCKASLQIGAQRATGDLWDICETGARLQLADAPYQGATAIMRWHGQEIACTVAWVQGDMCGVAFARAITPELVAETASLNRELEIPIASLGNIAPAQRRSSFRAGLRLVDGDPA